MSKYNVEYKKLASLLLPTCLRKKTLIGIAQAVVAPIARLSIDFDTFRAEKEYRLKHNGQTCHLRALLNDKFDPIERGITVTDADAQSEAVILHMRETSLFASVPLRSVGNLEIYRRGFGGANGLGFWVNVPQRLYGSINENALNAIVTEYKLASIRYGINYI